MDSESIHSLESSPRARPKGRGLAVVLVGMMGCGKTSIGRKLAARLGLPFLDADAEIELAAGMSVADIFELKGEAAFREGERRVISRILDTGGGIVLATGGGAFMDPGTRERIARSAISIWLKAPPEILIQRVSRRGNRPLLRTADPEGTLRSLLEDREPIYQQADIVVESLDADVAVRRAVEALAGVLAARKAARAGCSPTPKIGVGYPVGSM